MLTGKDASQLAAKALNAPLPWRKRRGLGMHVLFCTLCRRYARDLGFLRSALRVGPRSGCSGTHHADRDQAVPLGAEEHPVSADEGSRTVRCRGRRVIANLSLDRQAGVAGCNPETPEAR